MPKISIGYIDPVYDSLPSWKDTDMKWYKHEDIHIEIIIMEYNLQKGSFYALKFSYDLEPFVICHTETTSLFISQSIIYFMRQRSLI